LDVESDKYDIYPLPNELPTSAPKTRRFKRVINVDDKTGELTLHDGKDETKMKFNESAIDNYRIIEFDTTTKEVTFIPLSTLVTPISTVRYILTGSKVTHNFFRKLCDSTKRLYVQLEISNDQPIEIKGSPPLSDDEKSEIQSIATDVSLPDENSCQTKGHPIENVRGPVFDLDAFIPFNNSHINLGVQVYYYSKSHDSYTSKVELVRAFHGQDGPACYVNSLIKRQQVGVYQTVLFVLKDEVEQKNQDNAKAEEERRIEKNLKKVAGKKNVGDEVYFYETEAEEKSKQNPKKGNLTKLKGIKGMLGLGSNEVEYNGATIKVNNIYERDLAAESNSGGGNKNKKNKTRRKPIRKSIKNPKSQKGRKRRSIKKKIRRSRNRK
jgi:hypothetical protein